MEPVVAKVSELFQTVHAHMRDEVRAMDEAALNWTPGPGTNSTAALVIHTLGSEAEVLRTVRNEPGDRDRDAEFRANATTPDELVRRLDAADAYLQESAAAITAADLAAERPRGENAPQTGLHWLLTNYGHAREHLAHIQLTKQLYDQRHGG